MAYKRKHYYNKDKYFYDFNSKSTIKIYEQLKGDYLTPYEQFIIDLSTHRIEQINVPNTENLKEIMKNFDTEKIQEYVKILKQNKDYNPYTDLFPIELFNEAQINYIRKIQKFIETHYDYFKEYMVDSFRIIVAYNKEENSNFYCQNTILVLVSKSKVVIKHDDIALLRLITDRLNKKEPNNWVFSEKEKLITNIKNKTIHFYSDKFLSLLLPTSTN